ncbi:hypothetical protein N7517_001998 [Penicillium concentricum]|uniref:non-specific serine/threonine protein kinase n=1 Tax=Penicillium concentricum TaxID=293559 RepID=A0A9W9VJD4_9EURO|nr:uncharacterized protein N7517_001998 [Penicillium concentricum]KAJ5384087.1 hypothetical protein N7517_001998 [Penicillium concentricum]
METNSDINFDINDFKHDPLLLTQEGIHRYCPGGLHPVSLGDRFQNGRYTVHHKLGFGDSATVWLAKDTGRNGHVPKYQWIALKILAAHIKERTEIRNLQYLMDKSEGVLFTRCIVKLLDSFVLVGPNGIHQCLVLDLVGPSFESIQQSYIDFNNHAHRAAFDNAEFNNFTHCSHIEFPRIFEVTKRLFMALRFMHGLGMCHGGINGANIAFTFRNSLRNATEKEVFGAMGSPHVFPLERWDGVPLSKGLPKDIVQSAQWNGYLDADEYDIRLIGFGKSFVRGEEPDKLKQPVHQRSPEIIMGDKLDCRLDLWHTGCFIYQLLMYEPAFPGLSDDYEYIRNIVGFVEDLPVEWEAKLEELRLISDQNSALGKALDTDKERTKVLEATETETTVPDTLAPAEDSPAAEVSLAKDGTSSEAQHTSTTSPQRRLTTLASARPLKEVFEKKANNPMLAPLLPIIEGFLRFRPSDRLSLLAATELAESASLLALDKYIPLVVNATEGEQELPSSDVPARLELTGAQEAHRQPRLEAPVGALNVSGNREQQSRPAQDEVANSRDEDGPQPQDLSGMSQSPVQVQQETPVGTPEPLLSPEPQQPPESERYQSTENAQLETQIGISDPLLSHEPQQEEGSEVCQNVENPSLEAQTATLDLPSEHHDHQRVSPEISKDIEQDQLEAMDGTPDQFHGQGEQQPGVSDVCKSADKARSELQAVTSDLLSDHHEPQPASPEISKNPGQDQLIVDGAPDLLDSQSEQQSEMSETPESSNQPQLEHAEDSAASSDDGGERTPGNRKRLRSRIGGLLNQSWRPWKSRRKS